MRRVNLKREDGVAMTEFALIVPVFLLIVAGLLAFGRVFFYWIEANHMASETARWAVVDRNPYGRRKTLQQHAAQNSTVEFASDVKVCIDFPARPDDRRPRRARPRADPEAVQLPPHPRHGGDHDPRLARRCGSSASSDSGDPGSYTPSANEHRDLHVSTPLRDERGGILVHGGRDDPRVPAPDRARRRRRQLVHAQAAAPEPRRRRRVRRGRRVREELEGLRPDRRRRAARPTGARDRGRGAPVRRRPRGLRLRRRRRCPSTLRNTEIANQANLDVVINSNDPDYTDDTDYTDGGGTPPQGNPCYLHTTGDDISGGGPLDGRARQGARPAVALRLGRPPALAQRRPRADRDPPGDQRPPVPAARRAEQRDHEGAGALLRRVHRRPIARDARPRSRSPTSYQGTRHGRRHALGPPGRDGVGRPATRGSPSRCRATTALRPGATCPSASRCGSRAATRSTSTPTLRAAPRDASTPTASTGSRRSASGTTATRTTQVRIGDVHLTGGCGTRQPGRVLRHAPDRLRPTAATARTSTSTGAAATTGNLNAPTELHASRSTASRRRSPAPWQPGGDSWYSDPAGTLTATPGANTVTVARRLGRQRHLAHYQWTPPAATAAATPCRYSAHRAGAPGVRRHRRATAGAVALVRTSRSAVDRRTPDRRPATAYANQRRPAATGARSIPTIGIRDACSRPASTRRSASTTRRRTRRSAATPTTPRARSSPSSATAASRGTARTTSTATCSATDNTASWWNTSTRTCPDAAASGSRTATRARASASTRRNNPGAASSPRPACSTGQVGDWHRRGDRQLRQHPTTTRASNFDCNYDGDYDDWERPAASATPPGEPGAARLGVPARRQPVHRPVPGEQGPDRRRRRDPGARLRVVLRHGLGRRQLEPGDPCPDTTYDPTVRTGAAVTMPRAPEGAITGVFVEKVEYEPGPVDTTAICVEGQLTPCRVTLVR